MNFSPDVLDITEKTFLSLRTLYNQYGYRQYKMSKFEEYDLYSRNKDFLVSDAVITFTDTNGKLMALKPDVTLSIVKNVQDLPGSVQKLCYNESVYRVARNSSSFREIMQTGLECIGAVDPCCVGEVIWLAANSLAVISRDFMLDISHLDILTALVRRISPFSEVQQSILKCVSEKNIHGIDAICRSLNISLDLAAPLRKLLALYGTPSDVLPQIRALLVPLGLTCEVEALEQAVSTFSGSGLAGKIQIDFSVVSDPGYYNGIVFKGFVNGVPESVLSGGQYDRLMEKMNRSARAIGFAVYLDTLEYTEALADDYDVDLLLIYASDTAPSALRSAVTTLIAEGHNVCAVAEMNSRLRYRKLAEFRNGEVIILENNA